jgi:ketopantoate hydroxymethyltransferase
MWWDGQYLLMSKALGVCQKLKTKFCQRML